jgi:hypothetical protein
LFCSVLTSGKPNPRERCPGPPPASEAAPTPCSAANHSSPTRGCTPTSGQWTQAALELALFPAAATPASIASAEPLRPTGGGAPAEADLVTLGQARRHLEILQALRTQRDTANAVVSVPAVEHHPSDAAAVSARLATVDRERQQHEQRLAQTRRSRLSMRM